MGLLDWLLGRDLWGATPKRRRSPSQRRAPAPRSSAPRGAGAADTRARQREARHQQELADQLRHADERRQVREQLAWERKRKRERERQTAVKRERTQKVVQAHKSVRSELAGEPRPPATERTEMARKFVKLHGGTVESWEEILSRSGVSQVKKNPRRARNPQARSALSVAAGALASGGRSRNPFLTDVGLHVLTGAVTGLVTEELKGARRRQLGDFGELKPKRPRKATARPAQRTRKNPAVVVPGHPDEALQHMSERFHGERGHILRLGPDQRRPLPEYVVDVGQEVATVYRPPRSSQRGGATWEHEAGDVGEGRQKVSGRRRIVADSSGRTFAVPGSSRMRFDPDRGLVG